MLRTTQFGAAAAMALVVAIASPWLGRLAAQQSSAGRLQELEQRVNATVREMGSIESSSVEEIRSEVETSILWIVPEGSEVNQGDDLLTLDGSGLEDKLQQQRLTVAQTESKQAAVKQKLAGLNEERDARRTLDALALMAAEKRREQTLGENGELALQLKQTSADLNVARAKLEAAEQMLVSAKEGIVSRAEIAVAQAAATEAQEAIQVAEARQTYLQGPAREFQEIESRLAIEEARFAAQTM
ncbi:MAG: hypothetical protein ACC628_22100, partial [Pirellulaceae bacterium]